MKETAGKGNGGSTEANSSESKERPRPAERTRTKSEAEEARDDFDVNGQPINGIEIKAGKPRVPFYRYILTCVYEVKTPVFLYNEYGVG